MCSSHWLQADSQPPGDDSITLLIRQLWQKLIQEQRLDGTSPSSSRPASSHRWNPAAFLSLIANRRAELITKALSSLVTVPCCDASRGFPAAQLMELCSSLRRSAARNDVGHKVSVDPVEDSGIDVSHLEQRRHLWLLLSHSLAFAHTHTQMVEVPGLQTFTSNPLSFAITSAPSSHGCWGFY